MKRVLLTLCLILEASAICSAQQLTYYYPQIAIGGFGGGSWKTTIFISNATAPGGTPASGLITFTRSDGAPMNVQWVDDANRPVGSGNTIPFQLGGGETRKYTGASPSPLTTGFATVTANAAVLGTAVFTQLDSAGRMMAEAGVPAAIPLGRQAVIVDQTSGFKTGVAIANPNGAPLHITFELLDTVGNKLATTTRDLPPNQHTAFFVHEMFPAAPPIVGRLQFFCTNPMVAVALRFEPNFVLFTTMPPIAIAGLTHDAPAAMGVIDRRRLA